MAQRPFTRFLDAFPRSDALVVRLGPTGVEVDAEWRKLGVVEAQPTGDVHALGLHFHRQLFRRPETAALHHRLEVVKVAEGRSCGCTGGVYQVSDQQFQSVAISTHGYIRLNTQNNKKMLTIIRIIFRTMLRGIGTRIDRGARIFHRYTPHWMSNSPPHLHTLIIDRNT